MKARNQTTKRRRREEVSMDQETASRLRVFAVNLLVP
jgi:hypothetical protein